MRNKLVLAVVLVLVAAAAVWLLRGRGGGPSYTTVGVPLAQARQIVVLFHGYGAPGKDLEGLALELQRSGGLDATAFVLPEGPLRAGMGRAWYDEPAGLREQRTGLQALLRSLCAEAGLGLDAVVVGGFSQGGAMAVDTALHAPSPLGGVLALSAASDPTGDWAQAAAGPGPMRFLVAHGTGDTVVAERYARSLTTLLEGAGHEVTVVSFPGGHSIPAPVREAAARFLGGER